MNKNWKDQVWDVVLEVARRSDLSPDTLADCLTEARQTIYGEEDETTKKGGQDLKLWEWLKRYRGKGTVSEQSEGKMISISELLAAEKRFFELIDFHNAGRSKDGDIEELESLLAEINQQARTVIDLVKREQAKPSSQKS